MFLWAPGVVDLLSPEVWGISVDAIQIFFMSSSFCYGGISSQKKKRMGSSMRLSQCSFTGSGNCKRGRRFGFLFWGQNPLCLKHHYWVHLPHSSMRIWMTGEIMPSSYNISLFTFWFGSTFSLAKEIACMWMKGGRDLTHLMDTYRGCRALIKVVNELTNYRWPLNCGCTQRRNLAELVQFYCTDLQSWPNCVSKPVE